MALTGAAMLSRLDGDGARAPGEAAGGARTARPSARAMGKAGWEAVSETAEGGERGKQEEKHK